MRDYSFKPGLTASLIAMTVLPLFISLGVWQLHRADEKTNLIELQQQRMQDEPLILDAEQRSLDDIRYRRVVVSGEYDVDHQFLLDNQVYQQNPGYHVLTPLRIKGSDTAVLVNRGWVPMGASRAELPDVRIRQPSVRITGMVDRFPRVGLKLEGAEIPSAGWPAVVQLVDPARIGERLGYPVLPYQVLADDTAAEAYTRAWKETRLDPGKNLGYALQWFLFAAVALVLYVRHGIKAGTKAVVS
ncbi:SURF1 family protein [Methylocaldum szegediense]|uniref:SURF1-like protein n=1 Tax=Methylocaldum szegediense TaxID=73780 RepID=A0ABM9I2B4_9GAMM|nr:SURF1 family protein [Methylocaldum szegediense]CAI8835302.1 SURF1-like protein [Methylocaldum szegediense]